MDGYSTRDVSGRRGKEREGGREEDARATYLPEALGEEGKGGQSFPLVPLPFGLVQARREGRVLGWMYLPAPGRDATVGLVPWK